MFVVLIAPHESHANTRSAATSEAKLMFPPTGPNNQNASSYAKHDTRHAVAAQNSNVGMPVNGPFELGVGERSNTESKSGNRRRLCNASKVSAVISTGHPSK